MYYVIRKVLHVFKLSTGGLNQTKVYSIDTHEVHLSTILIHFILSSLCLCNIMNCNVIRKVLHVFKLSTGGLNQTKVYSIDTHEVHLSTILIHYFK